MLRWCCFLAFLPFAASAAVISVNEPWMRPAAAGASTDFFMELAVSEHATLVDVRTPAARKVSLAQGRQRHDPPLALDLAAQRPLLMSTQGTHLVLGGLARPLARGQRVPVTLVLRYADGTTQEILVDAEVRRRSPSEDHGVHRH